MGRGEVNKILVKKWMPFSSSSRGIINKGEVGNMLGMSLFQMNPSSDSVQQGLVSIILFWRSENLQGPVPHHLAILPHQETLQNLIKEISQQQ